MMVWLSNVPCREFMNEDEHGPECPCASCIIENGPIKYFVQGPAWHPSEKTRDELDYFGYVGLYRIRNKPWKTPKTNSDGRQRKRR